MAKEAWTQLSFNTAGFEIGKPERNGGLIFGNPAKSKDRLFNVIFEDIDGYNQLIDYVFEQYGGDGLQFTNLPIVTSLRVEAWLLPGIQDRFSLRAASPEDRARIWEQYIKDRIPADPRRPK